MAGAAPAAVIFVFVLLLVALRQYGRSRAAQRVVSAPALDAALAMAGMRSSAR